MQFHQNVEKNRQVILDTERFVWIHPETGFKEWETQNYLAKIFENAGYELTYAGNIPGGGNRAGGIPGICFLTEQQRCFVNLIFPAELLTQCGEFSQYQHEKTGRCGIQCPAMPHLGDIKTGPDEIHHIKTGPFCRFVHQQNAI